MRVLHIGDIVGKPGRRAVTKSLPGLIEEHELDFVVANAENAAAGSGITPANFDDLIGAGVDCVTLGDHIYRRREIINVLRDKTNIVKPANFPADAPGHTVAIVEARNGIRVAVISLLGRVFMRPVNCPWEAVDRELAALPADVQVVMIDFHAEATSDMQLMGRHLAGRVTSVLGTHTHVPTADEHVMAGGTAFQCDIGMTGPYDSILGRRVDRVLETTITFNPTHFEVATDDVRLAGTIVEVDPSTGRASGVWRLCADQAEIDRLSRLASPRASRI